MDEAPWWQSAPVPPPPPLPSPPSAPSGPSIPSAPSRPPAPPRSRARGWRTAGIVVLVALFAASGAALRLQQDRLSTTRTDLASLRSSVDAENARVDALEKTATAEQQSLTGLSAKLTTAQGQLTTTQAQLRVTQTQLQSAQTSLKADEQRLDLTTQKLPPDLTALATQVSPSVVLVTCTSPTSADAGTGFALALPTPAGFATSVVTAEHVIDACTDPSDGSTISLGAGAQTLTAQVRSFDVGDDVAILETTAKLPRLQPSSAPVVGEFLMAVGNPLGTINNNVTSGNVSEVYDSYFLDTAPISNGNSGGPVVDRTGKVVGIVDAGVTASVQAPVVENLNISLRLSSLCIQLLQGAECSALH